MSQRQQEQKQVAPGQAMPKPASLRGWVSQFVAFFNARLDLACGLVLALGFLIRLRAASGTFLNPDEAEHYLVANQSSLGLAYQASLLHPHPPLFIFVLYFWRHLGNSELVLRFPSIIAGTVFCWMVFKWLSNLLGLTVAWIALILVAFLPSLVALSAEVRNYSLLLMFLATALYFLERAFAENRVRLLSLSFISLYLAILSNYSALLVAAACCVYAALRMLRSRPSAKFVVAWIVGQAGAFGLFVFLYKTHLAKMKGSAMAKRAVEGWLSDSYFRPSVDHLPSFLLSRSIEVFQFIFDQRTIGFAAVLMFVVAVVLLFVARTPLEKTRPVREIGMLLLLPFGLSFAAAIVGLYPYGSTRHSIFLAVFGVAGVSVFLASVVRGRAGLGIAIAILIVAICQSFGDQREPGMAREAQNRVQMEQALQFIKQRVLPTDSIFIDNQTGILLRHYLCVGEAVSFNKPVNGFVTFKCDGHRIIAADAERGAFESQGFSVKCDDMVRSFGLRPDETVWVLQAGWGTKRTKLATELRNGFQEFHELQFQSFGNNIQIFKLAVAADAGRCQSVQSD